MAITSIVPAELRRTWSLLLAAVVCAGAGVVAPAQAPSRADTRLASTSTRRDARTATMLEEEATELEAAGDLAAAEQRYRSALETWEEVRGPENPSVGASLSRLAANLMRQKRFDEADPLLRRALEIKERVYGSRSGELLPALNNYAGLHVARGAYGAARELYFRALAIAEETYGASDAATGICLSNLAVAYLAEGRIAEADQLHRRAVTLAEAATGADRDALDAAVEGYAAMRAAARQSALRPAARSAPPRATGRVTDALFDGLQGPVHTVSVELELLAARDARSELARLAGPVVVYSADGSLESRTLKRGDGGVDSIETYRRGPDGQRIVARVAGATTDLDEDDVVSRTATFAYDASGNRVAEVLVDEDGNEISRWEITCDTAGRPVTRTLIRGGRIRYKETLVYDGRGMVAELRESANGSAVTRTTAFSYDVDSKGNWVKRVETDVTTPSAAARGPFVITRRTISYY